MNCVYRLVFNRARGLVRVTSEPGGDEWGSGLRTQCAGRKETSPRKNPALTPSLRRLRRLWTCHCCWLSRPRPQWMGVTVLRAQFISVLTFK